MLKKSFTTLALGLALLSGATTFATTAKADETAATKKALPKIYTAAETATFKSLAKATLDALAAGKQNEVVAKLTDLETAWDDKESTLKPKDEPTWTALDKTLDKAISALRSSHTNLENGKAALEKLLKLLDETTKA